MFLFNMAYNKCTALSCNSSKRIFLKPLSCSLGKIICFYASTSSEVASALRPFYFAVHPDLFGQHPTERAVNEASLQQLSSYIETILQSRTPSPTVLRFFLRKENRTKDSLNEVKINLKSRDLRQVVSNVLKACSLPTTAVEKIPKNFETQKKSFEDFKQYTDAGFDVRAEVRREKATYSLRTWLKKSCDEARLRQGASAPVREEALRRSENLAKALHLKEVKWDCGWSNAHFIGCIQSLHTLTQDHPDLLSVLKGRSLVFGNETGVSLDNLVILNSGEPRHNWLEISKHIPNAEKTLRRIPSLELALSGLLKDIRVMRRKFQQKVMVSDYESQLRRLATNLNDYRGFRNYPAEWPDTLQQYRLVVETAAGPLMLSPTGQFIVPSSCPAFLLVNFLTANLEKAKQVLEKYERDKTAEKLLSKQVAVYLGLEALRKDDAVTPERMVKCCNRLLDSIPIIGDSLKGAELRITHYYSVLSDGEICIPWDWTI